MRKIKQILMPLNKIKHIENSRLRMNDDVGELMEDIKQRGLLQAVGIRASDNALIYGNRRVKAFEKLGYKEILADIFEDVNDNELLITNLVENINRKDISSFEVGRVVSLLIERNYDLKEISSQFNMSIKRIKSCLRAYEVTKGTEFENLIAYNQGVKQGSLSEELIWRIQQGISRALGGKITNQQWKIMLEYAKEGKLHTQNVKELRSILMNNGGNVQNALDLLDKGKSTYLALYIDEKMLEKYKKGLGIENTHELLRYAIKKEFPKLIFTG